jgi:hypothetical protein
VKQIRQVLRHSRARTLCFCAAVAVTALLTACSASPSSTGSGGSTNAGGSTNSRSANSQLLAYAQCVRSRGVPNFPDPNSSGGFPKATLNQLAASNSQYQAATQACGHLLPNGGSGPTQAELQQSWNDMRTFAGCMRSHGVPNWPDPTRYYPQHPDRPYFNLQPVGIDPNSPQISTKIHECEPLLHGNNPQHLGEGAS